MDPSNGASLGTSRGNVMVSFTDSAISGLLMNLLRGKTVRRMGGSIVIFSGLDWAGLCHLGSLSFVYVRQNNSNGQSSTAAT